MFTSDYDKDRAREMFHRIIQTDRLHRCVIERFLASLGIHRSQHMTLMFLSKSDICPSQKNIASHFGISPAATTVTLKKLEEGGYIEREISSGDSRFNNIKITAKGKRIVEQSKELFEEADFEMFREFTKEDYAALDRCLSKMARGIKNYSDIMDTKLSSSQEQ